MRLSRVGVGVVLAIGMGVGAADAHAQLPPEVEFRIGMYLQVESQYSSLGTPEEGRFDMGLNRARALLEMTVNEWIFARLEPDFGRNRARVRNGYIEFRFDDALNLRAGQFKKPFGLIQRTSSSVIPVIERPTTILGLASRVEVRGEPIELPDGRSLVADEQTLLDVMGFQGYSVGAVMEGTAGRLEYAGGVFEGPLDAPAELGLSGVSARAAYMVTFGLKVGGAVSHSRIRFEDEQHDGTVGSVEVQLSEPGFPGFGLLGEGVWGSGVGTGTDFSGVHVIGWVHRGVGGRVSGVEPLVRFSRGDPDTDGDDDAGTLLTAGLNIYFGDRNRLMLNWDVYSAQNDAIGTESALRAQAQVRF